MSLADESSSSQSVEVHTDTQYHLSVCTQAGRLTVRVSAEPGDAEHIFSSLLLAFDYIERDLAPSQHSRKGAGLR
ncbi:hypothetical protein EHF33_05535 [Deinococcus psychrotolerans]|uniref:Uncharacterized protein n=1 Tax=Deinococcus psychrotolerans TaxID=2489213 RepID=A0A3G8YA64_9DEIO|nr:hypothetical protein [Deinococcus psychrotolerans]AZI42279.1 hypothetical protein EHF33_05535 [Deinococcus psychrotolerans]